MKSKAASGDWWQRLTVRNPWQWRRPNRDEDGGQFMRSTPGDGDGDRDQPGRRWWPIWDKEQLTSLEDLMPGFNRKNAGGRGEVMFIIQVQS
jgi:hypothetical protein